jgi:uncharacterized membrane protein YgcG
MPRFYLVSGALAILIFDLAQLRGWSAFESAAQEFQRLRAEQAQSRSSGGGSGRTSSGSSGGFSGK